MDFRVTIYIQTTIRGPAIRRGAGAYMIEYMKRDGTPETRQEILVEDDTTENFIALECLNMALAKLQKPCVVQVNTECEHILHTVNNGWLFQWERAGWKNARGKQVRNILLWQELLAMMDKHTITFGNEDNSYKNVMQADMEKELKKRRREDV
jgi:ribonuclease HI